MLQICKLDMVYAVACEPNLAVDVLRPFVLHVSVQHLAIRGPITRLF